jgi:hypothetical protein
MKEYRQDSHTRSLVVWAILCTATALVLFAHSNKVVNRALRTEEILGGVALLIFGPAALTVYLVRARRVWVSVDQIRGVIVSGRRVIPWEDIYKADRRRPRLRKSSGPAEVTPFNPDVGSGCGDGCLILGSEFILGLLLAVAALFAFWLVCFVFVPLLIIPVLEVFGPLGDRIRIHTRRGTFVLRDLRDADDFVRAIALRKEVTER